MNEDNKNNGDDKIVLLVMGMLVLGLILGFTCGYQLMKQDALYYNVGQYDSKTGNFEWKTNFVYITNFSLVKPVENNVFEYYKK